MYSHITYCAARTASLSCTEFYVRMYKFQLLKCRSSCNGLDGESAGSPSVVKRSAVKKYTLSVGLKVSVEEDVQCAVNIDNS